MNPPDHWHFLAAVQRLIADAPDCAPEFEADLELIQLLEHAVNELDRGAEVPRPIAFRLTAGMRSLLVTLFRVRVERDHFREAVRLLEQGQALLPLIEPRPAKQKP